MIRTQVYLTEEQYQKIKIVAIKEKKAAAEVLRDLLDLGLEGKEEVDLGEALMKIVDAGKKFKGKGPKDLSSNIDKYLYEDYEL